MQSYTTKTLECGHVVPTEKISQHEKLCGFRSKVQAYCGYCGELIQEFIFHPNYEMPNIRVLENIMICGTCHDDFLKFWRAFINKKNEKVK